MDAISLGRVSTPEQLENNSLNRQQTSIDRAAVELGVTIIRSWAGSASSLVGRNVNRKDVVEAYEFCQSHPTVKYLIIDEVDRFMRSIEEMFYWKVMFKQIGVKVYFASKPELNEENSRGRLLLSLDGFGAESSNEERQGKSIRGHEQAIREGRWTFHPKPGYMKSDKPGIHVPHTTEFKPFQKALKDIARGRRSISEAMIELNESEYTLTAAPLKSDKFKKYIQDPFYAGIIEVNKQVKQRTERGQHEPMITIQEHKAILRVLDATPALHTGVRKNYNSHFALGVIVGCPCDTAEGKLVGFTHNNGHGGIKDKYRCRKCQKTMLRSEAHEALSEYLDRMIINENYLEAFAQALQKTWERHRGESSRQILRLQQRIAALNDEIGALVDSLATNKRLAGHITVRIDTKEAEIKSIEKDIANIQEGSRSDLLAFMQFAVRYINGLKDTWWQSAPENQKLCLALLFPSGIYISKGKKVYTPEISFIYRLITKENEAAKPQKSLMVELVGTAPTSAGLSWLVFYKLSLFYGLSVMVSK